MPKSFQKDKGCLYENKSYKVGANLRKNKSPEKFQGFKIL